MLCSPLIDIFVLISVTAFVSPSKTVPAFAGQVISTPPNPSSSSAWGLVVLRKDFFNSESHGTQGAQVRRRGLSPTLYTKLTSSLHAWSHPTQDLCVDKAEVARLSLGGTPAYHRDLDWMGVRQATGLSAERDAWSSRDLSRTSFPLSPNLYIFS